MLSGPVPLPPLATMGHRVVVASRDLLGGARRSRRTCWTSSYSTSGAPVQLAEDAPTKSGSRKQLPTTHSSARVLRFRPRHAAQNKGQKQGQTGAEAAKRHSLIFFFLLRGTSPLVSAFVGCSRARLLGSRSAGSSAHLPVCLVAWVLPCASRGPGLRGPSTAASRHLQEASGGGPAGAGARVRQTALRGATDGCAELQYGSHRCRALERQVLWA
jgi:hypothetical protein